MFAAEWTNEILTLADPAVACVPPALPCLKVYGPASVGRVAVQRFIQRTYRKRFGAEVTNWAPCLVTLEDDGKGGEILAAAGYRPATQRLFLENYLPLPIERMLGEYLGRPVPREHIVEVGHFAARQSEHARQLMTCLARHLDRQGFEWVVSTVTLELRLLFGRMGLEPAVLAQAEPEKLGPDATQWGSYYSHRPKVVAGHVPGALRMLEGG